MPKKIERKIELYSIEKKDGIQNHFSAIELS